jgi:amino acid adenylation domain-containing protein
MTQQPQLSAARRALLEKLREGRLTQHIQPSRALPPLPRRTEDQPVPLSAGQQQLWFLSRLFPEQPIYNTFMVIELRGDLNRNALEQSLNTFIRRHEIWRTCFPEQDGQPVQQILPFEPLPVPFTDLQTVPRAEREARAYQVIEEDARQVFDLTHGPLLRARLLCLDEQLHWLALVVHHIIVDGMTTYQIFLPELRRYYEMITSGEDPSSLPAPPHQYADYALWQRERLTPEVQDELFTYWEECLKGAATTLHLPTDRPRPPIQTSHGQSYFFPLPQDLVEEARRFVRQEGLSLFTLLVAAFEILLYRYSQQEDFLIGTFSIERNQRPEFQELPGYLLNTIALRARLSAELEGRELLQQTRKTIADALAHEALPFNYLVNRLQVKRTGGENPLVQVAITLVPPQTPLACGWRIKEMNLSSGTSTFDLLLGLEEQPDGSMRGCFEYRTDLFDKETIVRLSRHWLMLLRALLTDPACPISRLPLLSAEERQQLLVDWNPPRSAQERPAGCIQQLFEEQARRTPQARALVTESAYLSYDELNRRANRLAHFLRRQGIGADIPVPLCLPRSPELLIALLAVLKAGGAYVPLDPKAPTERLSQMLEELEAPVVLTAQALLNTVPYPADRMLALDTLLPTLADESSVDPDWEVRPEHLAYIIYTSGSTGRPKGVLVSHEHIFHSTRSRLEYYSEPVKVHLPLLSLTFDSAMAGVIWTLCQGGTLVLLSDETLQDLSTLPDLIARYQVTHLLSIASLHRFMLEQARPGQLDSLRCVLVGGEQCPAALVQRHYERLPMTPLFNEYGPTEASVWSSVHPCLPHEPHPLIPIGRPLPHSRLYVLDPSLQPVPIGVPGELFIGGPSVARGYLQRPTLTSERFLPDPFVPSPTARMYRTGDRVRWRPDGSLVFLGRLDQQVKLRGYRIELGEIEAILTQHPSVREAAVIVREETPGNPYLAAYLTTPPGQRPEASTLRQYLQQHLPSYMVPSAFVILDALPLTAVGKVDRQALALLERPEQSKEAPVAPQNLLQQQLVTIWEDLLQVRPIGIKDDFFAIGGHSLLAARMIKRVEQVCGKKIPLATLLAGATIEHLAAVIEGQSATAQRSRTPVIPIQASGSKRPFFFLHGDWTGGAFYCLELARLLGEEQPFYGVEPYHFEEGQRLPTFEEMAAAHIEAIRAIQPTGPYRLGGWCNGALTAYEMARQLEASGEQVERLLLIDPTGPMARGSRARQACNLLRVIGRLLGQSEEQQVRWYQKLRYTYSLWRYKRSGRASIDEVTMQAQPPDEEHQKWTSTCGWILSRYTPARYQGRITFLWVAEEPWRRKPWQRLPLFQEKESRGEVESIELPGTHITSRTEHLPVLAGILKQCLERADAESSRTEGPAERATAVTSRSRES